MSKYKTKESVHNRAKEAVGLTLREINSGYEIGKGGKSSVGDAFENWFGNTKNSDSRPDMEEAGVELKATPFKKLKNGQYSAKERLVLNIINYDKLDKETFENSKFLYKNGTIELAFYEHVQGLSKDEFTIKEAVLYEMSKNEVDFEIIKQDWEIIQSYVRNGKAHELSESLTKYMSACTKGKNASSLRRQPHSDIKAKQRAFSLKAGYMTSILRKYVLGDEKIDSIYKDRFEVQEKSLEQFVEESFSPYVGWSIDELTEHFNITNKKSKNINYIVASEILNLKGKSTRSNPFPRVDEFEKASIVVKTVKFNEKNINKESMSFPSFKFKELADESWEDDDGIPTATWHNFLLETRFLFVVIKNDGEKDIFKGIKFFSIPEEDIEGPIRKVWVDTVEKLNEGVELIGTTNKSGKTIIKNNFINKTDKMICHVRPHTSESDYKVNGKYADELPTPAKWINRPKGEKYSDNWMTKQCFWLNNDYIKEQVQDLL